MDIHQVEIRNPTATIYRSISSDCTYNKWGEEKGEYVCHIIKVERQGSVRTAFYRCLGALLERD